LFVEVAEQGLVEAFVLALGGRLVGLTGNRLDPQGHDVDDELAQESTARRVERDPVVGQQPLGNAMGGHGLVEHDDRRLGGLAPGDVGRDRVAGVVVDELEDHALAPTGEHVLGGIELPAGVRGRIHEPAPGRPRFLPRLQTCHAGGSEDPGQRRHRGHHLQADRAHLVVHADRPMVQPGRFQRRTDAEGLLFDLVTELGRAGLRSPATRLKGRSRTVDTGPGADRIERLAGDLMLGAERRHRPTRRVIRPPDNRKTDTRINRLISGRHRSRQPEVSPPSTPDVSPMS
jgi:hypothetical protein